MTIETALQILRPGAAWSCHGGTYAGLTWSDPVQAKPTEAEVAAEVAKPEPIHVPQEVSLRQFRMALRRAGLFDQVQALTQHPELSQEQRGDLLEFIEYSNVIERAHPMITSLAPMVGVTTEQIDSLFVSASQL